MKKVLKLLFLGVLTATLLVASFGCVVDNKGSAAKEEGKSEKIKVGVVVPLSGDMAWAGEAIKSVAEYVAEELKASGGINGKEVEFIFEDDMATPANSVTAVQKMTNVYNVNAIYGPLFTNSLMAVKDIVNENKVVLIQPTSANPQIFQDKGYIFSLDCPTELSIKTHCEYLIKNKGLKTIALFGVQSDQTMSMIETFNKYWVEYGGEIVFSDMFNSATTDFRTELTQIRALDPDVLWFTGTAENGANIIRQAQELGFDDSTWFASDYEIISQTFYDDFGSFLDGHFHYTKAGVPGDERTKNLYNTLTEEFTASGRELSPITHLVYDAFDILFEAMKTGAYSGDALRQALIGLDVYEGATGYTDFEANGNPIRSVTIINYENGEEVSLILE